MKWLAPFLLALMALWSPARRADAQLSQGITGFTIDEEDFDVQTLININGKQCGGQFVFELNNIQPRLQVLEAWVTTSQSVNCNLATSRANSIVGQKSQCWRVGSQQNVYGKWKYPIDGSLIFNEGREADATRQGSRKCDEVTNKPYWVYFVALSSATQPDTQNVSEPLNPTPMTALFYLYKATPAAPTGLKVSGGEKRVLANWDGLGDPKVGSQAFFDVMPEGTGDTCSSSVLIGEGNLIEVDKRRIFTSGRLSKTSASLGDLEAKGVPIGGTVAVAVAQVDASDNIGQLSEVQCATVVATDGALDVCGTPEECGLETCGLSPASRGGWFGLSLFGLLLAALIRRRTA